MEQEQRQSTNRHEIEGRYDPLAVQRAMDHALNSMKRSAAKDYKHNRVNACNDFDESLREIITPRLICPSNL